MRKTLTLLILYGFLATLGYVSAESTSLVTEKDLTSLAESTMKQVIAGDYEAAFEGLKPYWVFPEDELDNLAAQTATQRANIEGRFGRSLGYELVRREAVGDFLLRLTYVEKTERHALRWLFTFYKPADAWIVSGLTWDDRISVLLGE